MRIEVVDACGQAELSRMEHRLTTRGYTLVDGKLVAGTYTWHPSDGAPGWQEWMYEITIALKEGDELSDLFEGILVRQG